MCKTAFPRLVYFTNTCHLRITSTSLERCPCVCVWATCLPLPPASRQTHHKWRKSPTFTEKRTLDVVLPRLVDTLPACKWTNTRIVETVSQWPGNVWQVNESLKQEGNSVRKSNFSGLCSSTDLKKKKHAVSVAGYASVFRQRTTEILNLLRYVHANRSSPRAVTGKWLLKN